MSSENRIARLAGRFNRDPEPLQSEGRRDPLQPSPVSTSAEALSDHVQSQPTAAAVPSSIAEEVRRWATTRPERPRRERQRQTLYLSDNVVARMEQAHLDLTAQLRVEIKKADLYEAMIEFALARLPEVLATMPSRPRG